MIAGNPVIRSFTKFGVYDRNWNEDWYCSCPRPGGEFTNQMQSRKFRLVVDDEQLAKQVAAKMNELLKLVPGAKRIKFKFPFFSFCTPDQVKDITIDKVET